MQEKIAIILPVRNFKTERYKRISRCLDSYYEFTEGLSDIFLLHDDDECDIYDPILNNYPNVKNICIKSGITLMEKINVHALEIANEYNYMGFIGDDIVFRTKWESEFIKVLSSSSCNLVYGNDLMYQKGEHATHPFITSNMVKAIGFFGLPVVNHHYFDNYWIEMVKRVGKTTFLPKVIMEHFHPVMNKAEKDAGFFEIESNFRNNFDNFRKYFDDGHFDKDVDKVQKSVYL